MTAETDTDDDWDYPPGVGPHEGCELDLMLGGEKPLAMFSGAADTEYEFPDAQFAPHVRSGRIVQREYRYPLLIRGTTRPMRELYYALPGEEWRVFAMRALYARTKGKGRTDADTHEIGRLLGYSEVEVQAYLDHCDTVEEKFRQCGAARR